MSDQTFTLTAPPPVPVPDGYPQARVTYVDFSESTGRVMGTLEIAGAALSFEATDRPDRPLIESPGDPYVGMDTHPELGDLLPDGCSPRVYVTYLRQLIAAVGQAYVALASTAARQATTFLLDSLNAPAQPTAAPAVADPPRRARTRAELEDLVCTLWLYLSDHTWKQLTTDQKELFADVLDEHHAHLDVQEATATTDHAYSPVERWWR